MYFRNYRVQKIWLLKCLKSPILEHSLNSQLVKGPQTLLQIHLQDVFLSGIWNPRAFC